MKRLITFSILFLSLLFFPTITVANHIAGGEINVKWLSGNTYEVTVKIWRDCNSASPFDPEWPIPNPYNQSVNGGNICGVNMFSRPWTDGRYLGDTVGIVLGIYDKVTNVRKDSLYMHLSKVTKINPPLGYCYKNPAVCIEEGLYVGTIDLANNPNGYILAWQRCCRNTGIANIDNAAVKTSPANQGSQFAGFVLYAEVPDPSLQNSTPVSVDYPSFVLCSNNPNTINSFKSTDANGDSLVYSIVSPLNGYTISGTLGTPNSAGQLWGNKSTLSGCDPAKGSFMGGILDQPNPIFPPVLWKAGYSVNNVFGGTPATTIDSKTGVITTGTGMLIGNYAIAVKVEEYRNGVKIGEIRRDAQFSMVNCAAVNVSIDNTAHVDCYTGNNGSATVSGNSTNGGPYTYKWTPNNSATNIATGLVAGTYSVTVSDNNGCLTTSSVIITQPTQVIPNINSTTPVNCFGDNTGSATANPSGGTPNYTYSWSTATPQTTQTATGLASGTYTVIVSDSKGCTNRQSVTLTQPSAALTSTVTAGGSVSCFGGNNGTATTSTSGGTPNYTYFWQPGGQGTSSISSLSAGTYTITITDAKGCTNQQTVSITQPPGGLSVTTDPINSVSCSGGNNGSATANPSGGTPNYTYAWLPGGQTTKSISNLSSGSYTVTVTDAGGCSNQQTVAITQPNAALSGTATATNNVSCFGGSNGVATVTPNGGTPNYTYSWLPGGETTSSISNLTSGTYTVSITDAQGCTNRQAVSISQPNASLSGTATATNNVSCFGGSNGVATVTPNGGTPNYTYSWLPGGEATSSISNLTSGTYTVSITDAQGCTNRQTVSISQPTFSLTAAVSATSNVSCLGGNNGVATASPTGGTASYTYNWLPGGQSTSSVSNLTAGTYTVLVTDAKACTNLQSITITEPATGVNVTYVSTPAACDKNNGTISLTSTGGTPNYTYQWNPNVSTGNSASNLSVGTFTVIVRDLQGCTQTIIPTVPKPPGVKAGFTFNPARGVPPLVVNFTNGSVGGIRYEWNYGDTINTMVQDTSWNPNHTYKDTGKFVVRLISYNSFGCSDTLYATILVNPKSVLCVPNVFSPNGDGQNDIWKLCPGGGGGANMEFLEVVIYDRWGLIIYQWDTPDGGWDGRSTAGKEVPEGTYYYVVRARGVDQIDYGTTGGFLMLLRQ